MARDLRLLPGRERLVELFERECGLHFEARDFVADSRGVAAVGRAQFVRLRFKLGDRFLEIEVGAHFGTNVGPKLNLYSKSGSNWPPPFFRVNLAGTEQAPHIR